MNPDGNRGPVAIAPDSSNVATPYDGEGTLTFEDLKLPGCVYRIAAVVGIFYTTEVALNSLLLVYIMDKIDVDLGRPHLQMSDFELGYFSSRSGRQFFRQFLYPFIQIDNLHVFDGSVGCGVPSGLYTDEVAGLRGRGTERDGGSLLSGLDDAFRLRSNENGTEIVGLPSEDLFFWIVWTVALFDLLSIVIVTLLKNEVHCLSSDDCYLAGFVYCFFTAFLGFVIFVSGWKPSEAVSAKAPRIMVYALWT